MITYVDTSALIKLILAEPESAEMGRVWEDAAHRVGSTLLYPEARAVLAAARRHRRLRPARAVQARAELDRLIGKVELLHPNRTLLLEAANLTDRHPLRGYDAVHLASALSFGRDTRLATWDKRLRTAAYVEGLEIVAPV